MERQETETTDDTQTSHFRREWTVPLSFTGTGTVAYRYKYQYVVS
jgi:hypothetical protein